MKKGKLTFAALIIALMLITIDVFFFILVRPAFIALTGALAAYGYVRGAMDFRNWLWEDRGASLKPVTFSSNTASTKKSTGSVKPLPPRRAEYEVREKMDADSMDIDSVIESITRKQAYE